MIIHSPARASLKPPSKDLWSRVVKAIHNETNEDAPPIENLIGLLYECYYANSYTVDALKTDLATISGRLHELDKICS